MLIKITVPNKFKFKMVPTIRSLLLLNQQDVHYIGGAEVLPPPLSAEDERAAIEKLDSEEDAEAKALLIEHNLRLVVYISKKFDNTSVGVEDLISIGTIGLIKAINSFKPDKNIKLACLLYTSPSPRDETSSRMPSSA